MSARPDHTIEPVAPVTRVNGLCKNGHNVRSDERVREGARWSRPDGSGPRGPAQLVLTASVARRYYLDGRSKVEIAEEFALSRFKVARLLEDARSSGLVRIEIGHPGVIDVELSARLMEALGLQHCVVTDTPDDHPASLREHLGAAAAELLTEIVTPDDVLGLSWARSVSAMAGALQQPGHRAGRAAHRRAAPARASTTARSSWSARSRASSGGPAYFFYAPMAVPDAATAQALRRQPEVARALRPDRLGDQGCRRRRARGRRSSPRSTTPPAKPSARELAAARGRAPRSPACSSTPQGAPVTADADRAHDRHHRGADARDPGGDRDRLRDRRRSARCSPRCAAGWWTAWSPTRRWR